MSIKPEGRHAAALRLLPLLDLTRLGDSDTTQEIEALCAQARTPWGVPAAVCVHPEHVASARRALADQPILVATVANFPDGGEDADRVEREIHRVRGAGAQEVDVVMPYRAFRNGLVESVRRVLEAARRACGSGVTLKVILETGLLSVPEQVRAACELALECGADFLQTSTGKVAVNATPAAAAAMLDAISASGTACGFKAAGGIRTIEDALTYWQLAAERWGAHAVTSNRFRLGASSLFDELRVALAQDS